MIQKTHTCNISMIFNLVSRTYSSCITLGKVFFSSAFMSVSSGSLSSFLPSPTLTASLATLRTAIALPTAKNTKDYRVSKFETERHEES